MLNYRHLRDVWIDAIADLVSPPEGVKLPWWPKLNAAVGGLRPHELTLLCAPTGAGKTQLLANISAQLLEQSVPHFVAPVETGDRDYVTRVVSSLDRRDYNTGEPVRMGTIEALTARYGEEFQRPLYIATYDNRVEVEELINLLKFMHSEHGIRVALLDNLNFFLKVVSSQMEKAEMDSAVHNFVILAKRLPIHIILIVHPRKTEQGRVESEFDIKGSSTAVQEASNVLLFNRPKPNDVEDEKRKLTDRELVFRKIRRRGFNVGKSFWLEYQQGRLEEFEDGHYGST